MSDYRLNLMGKYVKVTHRLVRKDEKNIREWLSEEITPVHGWVTRFTWKCNGEYFPSEGGTYSIPGCESIPAYFACTSKIPCVEITLTSTGTSKDKIFCPRSGIMLSKIKSNNNKRSSWDKSYIYPKENKFYAEGNKGGEFLSLEKINQNNSNLVKLIVGHCCVPYVRHMVPIEIITSLLSQMDFDNKEDLIEKLDWDKDYAKELVNSIEKKEF